MPPRPRKGRTVVEESFDFGLRRLRISDFGFSGPADAGEDCNGLIALLPKFLSELGVSNHGILKKLEPIQGLRRPLFRQSRFCG